MSQQSGAEIMQETILAGHYQLVKPLGKGGFGVTFLARDTHLPGTPLCVVKQLKPKANDDSTLEAAKRLFDREAQILYRLGSHSQIPRLLAHFEQEGEFYLVQEFIEGLPLNQEITTGTQKGEAYVVAFLQEILQVLAFVHRQNVIHRDIKPANLIRRSKDNKIILIDFGAVKEVRSQTNKSHDDYTQTVVVGSPGYMPNEQMAGTPYFSSDVYAVGMIAIRALTGVHPKEIESDSQTGEVSWRMLAPNVNPELADMLDYMVRYDFRDRYPTAVQTLEALQSLPLVTADSLIVTSRQPQSASPTEAPTILLKESPSLTNWRPKVPKRISKAPSSASPPLVETSTPPTRLTGSAPEAPLSDKPVSSPAKQENTTKIQGRGWAPSLAIISISVGLTFLVSWALLPRRSVYRDVYRTIYEDPVLISLLGKADRLRQEGKYQESITAYNQAIARNTQVPEAHWGKCYSLNKLSQPEAAFDACAQALKLNPKYPEAFSSQGYALHQMEKYTSALDHFDHALELKPEFAEAWTNKGVTLQALGNHTDALDAFKKAIEINPNHAEVWANQGAALWGLGRYDEAVDSIDRALKIDPNHLSATKLREQARQELGR
ncbi:MAG: serine/threonine-protein kinase [Leptolyngbyaceae cyanobacterium MO_188.B28]|nr:serine/threonine-protein kinase [Leptolyngbyaceae cyanobacterium MO_188.B28]